MFTAQEYENAKELIRQFEMAQAATAIKDLKCICCGLSILPHSWESVSLGNLDKISWKHGGVGLISYGYGSVLDENEYYVAICDKCMQSAIDQKVPIRRERI